MADKKDDIVLSIRGMSKSFGRNRVLDHINLDVKRGTVMGLMGENGAGKSTMMKCLFGTYQKDEGTIILDGKEVSFSGPKDALENGIAMVHQELNQCLERNVMDNLFLGRYPVNSLGVIDEGRMKKEASELFRRLGMTVNLTQPMRKMSVSQRQMCEIAKAISYNSKVIVLDEPTSVLTPQAVRKLFKTLHQLANEGVSILFISHKLDEIRELADRCVVLRAGKIVASVNPKTESEDSLARLMIGKEPPVVREAQREPGEVIFELKGVTTPGTERVCGTENVTLSARKGEIIGIAGISGNGQARLMAIASGEYRTAPELVTLYGSPIGDLDTKARRIAGLRYVPEQRLGHAAVPELSLVANTYLTGDNLFRGGFILAEKGRAFANKIIERFHVKTSSPQQHAGSLSGGNLQKYIMGREILSRPHVLLVSQPTWGVDVGAAAVIRNALMRLRDDGASVIVVSEEIDELFEISDRIAVMYRGALSPAVPKDRISIEEVGRWLSCLWPVSPFGNHEEEA